MKRDKMDYMYDLVVIGAGSGGVRAARISAGHGAKVAVIEGDRPGGTCVIRGCVPKKLLMYGSLFSADVEDARGFGWHVDKPTHDWEHLITAKNTELKRLESIYVSLLENAGATLIRGFAKVTGAHSVEVNGDEITAETILVAVGGIPQMTDVLGMHDHAITSNEALDLDVFPSEIVIYGGGYIALEFAGIFNGYGAKTHLVYRGDLPLRGFDEDVRRHIAVAMQDRGITLHPGITIDALEDDNGRKIATLSDGKKIHADQVMAATGRKPNTESLGLDQIGVEMGRNGEVLVDPHSRTSVSSIYAVGDVTDRVNLTPVAINEGHAFADTLYGNNDRIISHDNIASAVFSQPPIATVGLSEADASEKYDKIRVYESQFRAMKNTISGRGEKTYMKLIVDDATNKVVGAHMMGPDSGEIMQGIGIAVKVGATKADFDATIGIHPTAAEEFVTMRSPRD
jgi:glutathione reductase (NADPH)